MNFCFHTIRKLVRRGLPSSETRFGMAVQISLSASFIVPWSSFLVSRSDLQFVAASILCLQQRTSRKLFSNLMSRWTGGAVFERSIRENVSKSIKCVWWFFINHINRNILTRQAVFLHFASLALLLILRENLLIHQQCGLGIVLDSRGGRINTWLRAVPGVWRSSHASE